MSSDYDLEIIQLVDRVEKADAEFGQDLWLIAERVLLQRLIISHDKESQLKAILQEIKRIKAKNPSGNQIENTETAASFQYIRGDQNLSSGFSLAVDSLEGMDSAELYRLISWLKDASNDDSYLTSENIQAENDRALQDEITHAVFSLSRSGIRMMQDTIYRKFGEAAPVKLYDAGERYGIRIGSLFKKKGLKLEKTIREIEKTAGLAGWGDIHFHRVSVNEVECIITRTMFSSERARMKASCYFAAGVLGGIISSMLDMQERFVARETECVADGHDFCKFSITRSVETKQVPQSRTSV